METHDQTLNRWLTQSFLFSLYCEAGTRDGREPEPKGRGGREVPMKGHEVSAV